MNLDPRERDLELEIAAHGRLPVAEAVDIVVEIAELLAQLHERGSVHGRVSASNILVKRGVSGSAKLKPPASSTNASPRPTLYSAPEQVGGGVPHAASDIWSLAVVLYEAITGTLPFDEVSEIGHGEFAPLRSRQPMCPPQVEMAIMSCLQPDPMARTRFVVELALAIAPWGGSRSASAVPRLRSRKPREDEALTRTKPREDEALIRTEPPPSDPTLHVPPSQEPTHHAADDEGATLLVPPAPQLTTDPVPPRVPDAPTKRPRPQPSAASDRTQRISTADYQEMSMRGRVPPRPQQFVAAPPMTRAASAPEIALRPKTSMLPIWISICAAIVFIVTATAATAIFWQTQRARSR